MKYGVPLDKNVGPAMFIVYTLTLQYMLNYYNVTYHSNADDIQIYLKLNSLKHTTVLNAVQLWMFKRKLMLNKGKSKIMVVGYPLQMRNTDLLSSIKLD